MQVIVKGRHTEVPEALKEAAVEKLEKVRRFFDRIISLEIEFSEEHSNRIANKHSVEVTLTTKGHLLRAHSRGPDPSSALDAVVDKLEAQVRKLKDKMVKRGRRASENGRSPRNLETGLNEIELAAAVEDETTVDTGATTEPSA
jgi:putative sigma-54 modulation protein